METLCRTLIRAVIVLEVEPQRADRSAWCLPLRTAVFLKGHVFIHPPAPAQTESGIKRGSEVLFLFSRSKEIA